ncbi:hypothetical protein CAL26_09155 [Bordetella genomosp. 9]|uniref:Uncharacterized protein n=1 Tax=Bordetella genomosp. 9 TaxID=1416803 RepID=A0A261REY6_9BORD|nr:hypothetical protein [Bordetella genomosp. 9]OZI23598.1 hypothetical protein CAL26_09155 [Bordetella genomosp. 9]
MSSPTIEETLGHLRAGCLLADLQSSLASVVQAVDATGKAGKLTLQLTIRKVSRSGALEILDKITTVEPEEAPLTTLMYPTPEGRLSPSDPRQQALDLKQLPQAGSATLRSIGGQ